jgi:hypothetical protein
MKVHLFFSFLLLATIAQAAENRFIAIVEVDNASVRRGSEPFLSRVSFFDLGSGRLKGRVGTVEVPYVAATPSADTFLVASYLSTKEGQKVTEIREYDPRLNEIVATYSHPRPMLLASAPGLESGIEVMKSGDKLLWLLTSAGAPNIPALLEAIDWKTKKVAYQYALPKGTQEAEFWPFGEDKCLLLVHSNDEYPKTRAVILNNGTASQPVDVGLKRGEILRQIDVAGDSAIGVTSTSGRFIQIKLERKGPTTRQAAVNLSELRGNGNIASQIHFSPNPQHTVICVSGDHGIESLLIIQSDSGQVEKAVQLPSPIRSLTRLGDRWYALDASGSSIVGYDSDFKVVTTVKLMPNVVTIVPGK